MLQFDRQDCIFCKIHINFYIEHTKIVNLDIHLDEDGADIKYSLWAHKECLPTPIKEALGF